MRYFRSILIGLVLVFASFAMAQDKAAAPADSAVKEVKAADQAVKQDLAHASNEAAHGEHAEGEEDHAELKHSPTVKAIAKATGLSVGVAYWLLVVLNFAIIGGLFGWALKKNLPGLFQSRTETIRKSMEEARRASEEANRRLGDIEGRLSRLGSDIAELKKKSEADAAAEEERIRLSAEEEGRKIVRSAEEEIEAAAKAARRDLKAYTAELAVSLAEKRIQIDPQTDQALMNTFVRQLGKGGR